MKLLVDMNLSPRWADLLGRLGFEAVHWSTVGAATAGDDEILAWAAQQHFVVVTSDLDFSAILAASPATGPSVVQIRTHDLMSDASIALVARVINDLGVEIERGALVSVDEDGGRIRMLPLRRTDSQ